MYLQMNNSVDDGGSSIILSTSSTPSISYFVEYRARLRVVQVFLTCLGFPDGPGTVTLTVPSTDDLNATISWQRDAAGPSELATTSLIFPTAVAKTAITRQVEKLDGEHSFKLVALPNSSAENSQMVPLRPPLSAQELQSLNASTLICSECSSHIVKLCDPKGFSPITFRNLPSAHWREIADAWLCHPQGGDDFTKRYSKKMEEGFWPDKETVLVSLWELWFDQSRMVGSYIPSQVSVFKHLPSLICHLLSPISHPPRTSKEGQSPTQSSILREWLKSYRYKCPIIKSTFLFPNLKNHSLGRRI